MTYENDVISSEEKQSTGDLSGDYVLLVNQDVTEDCRRKGWGSAYWWLKVGFSGVFLLLIAAACATWGGPLVINKVVVPIMEWEEATFDKPTLAIMLFAAIAIFPTLLIPSSPSMWLAGMAFGYGYGFLLIIGAVSLGMSLPFLIGCLFRRRIHQWLERWPEKAAIARLAGEGDWLHQFRAVFLIRISPFPYIVFNYAAVATNVKYCPYIVGSLLGIIPDILVSIYSGILFRSFADASSHGRGSLSVLQIVFNVIGFGSAVGATIIITAYAKEALRRLQLEGRLQ